MSAVLRGRNLSLEQSLAVLANAIQRQLPAHMESMPGPEGVTHNVLIPAFLKGELRYYTIDMTLSPDRKQFLFRHTRHVVEKPGARLQTPRFGAGGNGAPLLATDKGWMRPLLRLVRAYDQLKVPPHLVADKTGTTRDPSSPALPTLATGLDVAALAGALMPIFMKSAENLRTGGAFADLTTDKLRAATAHLTTDPDERLR